MGDEIKDLFKKAPAKITLSELWKMARWFVIRFYSRHALRGDLGDVHSSKKGQNYIEKKRVGGIFTSDSTKQSRPMGPSNCSCKLT